MMKVWNAVLVSSSFSSGIFGTMLTRSGMVSSVHAFGNRPWKILTSFLALSIARHRISDPGPAELPEE